MRFPLVLAFLGLATCARAQTPIDVPTAASYFAEVEKLSRADGGKLWGVPLAGPILFVDARTQSVVTNQPDKEGKLTKQSDAWVGKLPDSIAAANTAQEWAGVHWTMVMWPLPVMAHPRGQLMMHECYHRIQDHLGLPATNPNNGHLDDKDGRIWMRLEMRALAEALSNTGRARDDAIRDALAFRDERARRCGATSVEMERLLEMNEGLAEYTGLVLSGYGKPSLETRAAVRLEQEQTSSTFARSFAYATGPAYGLLLDAKGLPWRTGLKATGSLPEMLRQATRASSVADVTAAAEPYGGAQVIAFETRQAERRAKRIAEFKKQFVESAVIALPVAGQFGFSFDPNGVESFPGVGQVFDSAKISDEWGVLQVNSGGVLMKRPADKYTGVAIRAPANPSGSTITGEGWTLQLNAGWKLTPGSRPGDWTVTKG